MNSKEENYDILAKSFEGEPSIPLHSRQEKLINSKGKIRLLSNMEVRRQQRAYLIKAQKRFLKLIEDLLANT